MGIGLPKNMSRDDAYIQGLSDGMGIVIEDLPSSYRLAMEGQGIAPDIIQRIMNEVNDYIDNHYN